MTLGGVQRTHMQPIAWFHACLDFVVSGYSPPHERE